MILLQQLRHSARGKTQCLDGIPANGPRKCVGDGPLRPQARQSLNRVDHVALAGGVGAEKDGHSRKLDLHITKGLETVDPESFQHEDLLPPNRQQHGVQQAFFFAATRIEGREGVGQAEEGRAAVKLGLDQSAEGVGAAAGLEEHGGVDAVEGGGVGGFQLRVGPDEAGTAAPALFLPPHST